MTRPKLDRVLLSILIRDSRVQPRESINLTTVSDYALAMAKAPVYRDAGLTVRPFPPIVVFCEQNERGFDLYWLADGWHRVLAAEEVGETTFLAEVYEGGVYEAVMYAAGANAEHGLKRTQRDKHRAVRMLFDHPTVIREQWSNARVAHAAGVSESLVRTVRRDREQELGLPPSTERAGRDGKVYSLQTRQAPQETSRSGEMGADTSSSLSTAPVSVSDDPDVFMYQCETVGCAAVTTEPSWHCTTCDAHLPKDYYPPEQGCPACSGDERDILALDPIATVEDRVVPKLARNGTTQVPYTPGTMKPSETTLAYERLVTALDLLESLSDSSVSDVLSETTDSTQLKRRLYAVVGMIEDMIDRMTPVGVAP